MTYASEVLADSPRAYWRMGDGSGTTMSDSSGNARPGTYSGVTLGTTGLAGDSDTAVTFNGSTSYATVPDASWQTVTAFTAEAIIKPSATSSYRSIISADGQSTSARGWNLYLLGGQLHVFQNGAILTGSSTISAGTAAHVAVTCDGTTTKVWLNGVQDGTVSAALNDSPYGLMVGASWAATTSASFLFAGVIDEVAFYGSALSGSRLAAHAAAAGFGGGGSTALAGTVAATSAASGSLIANRLFVGSVAATSALSGSLAGSSGGLSGVVPVTSGTSGTTVNADAPDDAAEYAPELTPPTSPAVTTVGRALTSVAVSIPFPTLVDGRPQ